MISNYKFLEKRSTVIIISIILGLGLATMFKKICKGNNCYVVQCSQDPDEIMSKIYKQPNEDCVKYVKVDVPCDS